jgi:selenocysteine lyase/cysteine desulfurase
MDTLRGGHLLEVVQRDFIGLDTCYPVADGATRRRVYLDSAATTLMLRAAHDTAREFLRHYGNTHSRIHFSARAATETYAHARARALSFIGADPAQYVCLFVGNGSTGALNRAAYYLRAYRSQPATVLVSLMEHHSNDLPHRRRGRVRHVPLAGAAPALSIVDVDTFTALLRAEPVRYAAVSMASNVTGIVNPIADLTAAARAEGVPIVVDASQTVARLPVRMSALGQPDALAFSGHKVYAPGSPGVLIIRREIVEAARPRELGGGTVTEVSAHDYTLAPELSDRDEAGTPNVVGAVTLAAVLDVLERIAIDTVAEHERLLSEFLMKELRGVPELRLYGSIGPFAPPRIGVASFNIGALDHGFVAAVLNDCFGIAVRNECFCAHPYVRALLAPELWDLEASDDPEEAERDVRRRRGMVRASLAMYSSPDDIRALGSALREIQANPHRYRELYCLDEHGEYRHKRFRPPDAFDVSATIDRALLRARPGSSVALRT